MQTGLTMGIGDGKDISFKEFALKCARVMTPLIELRDEPLDSEIPNSFKPSDYHTRAIEKAQKELSKIQKWSLRKSEQEALIAHKKAFKELEDAMKSSSKSCNAFMDMLQKVVNWNAPTPDHEDLKKFMSEQLIVSLRWGMVSSRLLSVPMTGKKYKAMKVASLRSDITYHKRKYKAELKLAAERTSWVRELKLSLEENENRSE
jgi:hypothetical protein